MSGARSPKKAKSHHEEHAPAADAAAAAAAKKAERDLHPELASALAAYRAERAFDAKDWVQKKCAMFNEYMKKCGLSACLVSLSGGVDSACTLGLMKHAMEMKDSPIKRILAIAQPIHSSAWALNRATECAQALGVQLVTVDQTDLHTQLSGLVDKAIGIQGKSFATGQLRSYMRTPVNYYMAQLLSQAGTPCVVMGTGNRDEDGYLLYYCKAGDGTVDIQLIADIHKSEVFKVSAELGVPKSILVAPPSADLWEGHTDEDELGFSYDFVELFTGWYLAQDAAKQQAWRRSLSAEAGAQFDRWSAAAQAVHRRNSHKLNSPHNLNVL